ncbi:MAG: hypothetical protein KAJ20_04670, partial [Candidatus Aenigmarchaeota archaeon]|nr:hypothetical protein [Candidatus Aenigmarchaeota archaeon]
MQTDNQVRNDVKVYGTGLGDISWGNDDKIINTLSVSYAEPKSDFVFDASSASFGPGDDIVFFVRVSPEDYRVLDLDLQPCLSDPAIIDIAETKKRLILEPESGDMVAYWTGHVSSSLSDRMIYTCPMTLNSNYLEDRVLNITISAQEKDSVSLSSSVSKPIMSLGDMQEIAVVATRTAGSGSVSLGIVFEDYQDEGSVDFSDGKASAVFMFRPDRTGNNEVIVYSSTGDMETLSFDVVEKGSVYIDGLEYPGQIRKGDDVRMNISIRNDKADDVTVKLYYGSGIETLAIPADSIIVIEKAIDTSAAGERSEAVKITGQDIVDAEYADIVIYDIPEISYDTSYDYGQARL